MYTQYLCRCVNCGGWTSKKYARTHNNSCKACAAPNTSTLTRNERIIESGYEAYATEEGHYNIPD